MTEAHADGAEPRGRTPELTRVKLTAEEYLAEGAVESGWNGMAEVEVDADTLDRLYHEDQIDLGLRRAMERHYNDGDALTRDEMRAIGKPWSPFSSVATWYLWRSLDPVGF